MQQRFLVEVKFIGKAFLRSGAIIQKLVHEISLAFSAPMQQLQLLKSFSRKFTT